MKKIIALCFTHVIFWLSLSVLLLSFYLQYGLGLQPCPLCLMQRFCVALITFTALVGLVFRGRPYLLLGQLIFISFGLFFSLRQIWLQSLPVGEAPACMPDLSILIHYFPWQDVLRSLIWGAGDCAEIPWQWLGFSLAAWSLIYFVIMAAAVIYLQFYYFCSKRLVNSDRT